MSNRSRYLLCGYRGTLAAFRPPIAVSVVRAADFRFKNLLDLEVITGVFDGRLLAVVKENFVGANTDDFISGLLPKNFPQAWHVLETENDTGTLRAAFHQQFVQIVQLTCVSQLINEEPSLTGVPCWLVGKLPQHLNHAFEHGAVERLNHSVL